MIYAKSFSVGVAMACLLTAAPAAADPNKHESGHGPSHWRYHDHHNDGDEHRGKRSERKEEYWDGNCKVERKWERHGEYKEERKCRGNSYAEPLSGVVISLPPIVVIPADR
jgi:hypothetical protein